MARYKAVRDVVSRVAVPAGEPLASSRDVDRRMRPTLGPLDHERVIVLGLDTRGRVVAEVIAGIGGANECVAYPKDIFRRVLTADRPVRALVLVHNHPSGDPAPSPDDARLTELVAAAGKVIGIALLDHVIVASGGYFSFADAGLLVAEVS